MKKFIFFVLFILICGVAFAESQSDEQKKLDRIQTELESQKIKLKLTKAQEQKALNNLYLIKSKLKKAQNSLIEAKGKITFNKKKIVEMKKELSSAEMEIFKNSKTLKKRIIEAYKSRSGGLIDIIFSSRSMSDLIDTSYFFGRLIGRDVELINSIRQQVNIIKRSRTDLESSNIEIKDMVKVIEVEKRDIAYSSKEKERIYKQLQSRRKEYERRIKQLEASSLEIERFVKSRGVSRSVSTGRFDWPARGRLVSKFGYRRHPIWGGFHLHTGIDIAAPYGNPIISADSGEVIFSGWWDGYGKAIVIDHGRGYTTVYGHMSRVYMQAGQNVGKGQIIGLVGSTGFSTGPHLHFEVRYYGKPVDPLTYLI